MIDICSSSIITLSGLISWASIKIWLRRILSECKLCYSLLVTKKIYKDLDTIGMQSCKKLRKPTIMQCNVDRQQICRITSIVYLKSSSVQDEWIGDKVSGAYGEVAGKFGLYSWCIGRYLSESGDQTSHCFSAESVTRDYIIPVIKFCQIKKISDIFIAMACIHVM